MLLNTLDASSLGNLLTGKQWKLKCQEKKQLDLAKARLELEKTRLEYVRIFNTASSFN